MIAALILAAAQAAEPAPAELQSFTPQGFRTRIEVEIAAPREEVFEAATGDVTGWWDHSFALDPAEMVIEPVFGGRFYERLEAGSDDGALHARVIYVDAPGVLRLHGPLGLSGRAVDIVTSWTLTEAEDGAATAFTVDLAMTGEIDAELAGIVRQVWVHFIEGRLKPYVEAGCHTAPDDPCAAFAVTDRQLRNRFQSPGPQGRGFSF
ncbi:MAG: SRPBCC domain-containing protein [Oceanicaulis sp.]